MDADTAYENLLRAIEAEGYQVLMDVNGAITLEKIAEKIKNPCPRCCGDHDESVCGEYIAECQRLHDLATGWTGWSRS